MVGPLLSSTPALVLVNSPHGVTPGGLLLVVIFLLMQDSLVWVLDTLYPWDQQYPVLKKHPFGFELAFWELLFARSALSEAIALGHAVNVRGF